MVAGGFAYGYLHIAQNNYAQEMFTELLTIIQPARILEIGTLHGGLTLMLRDIMDKINLFDNIISTYDINDQEFLKPLIKDRNIQVFTENLFSDDYTAFKNNEVLLNLTNFMHSPGTTLVLCDGGCKKCEFKLMSSLLKSGDIIMAHDYAPNQQYFETYIKNQIWDWLEIQESDIIDSIVQFNLQSFNEDLTQKAAWCCKIKN